MKEKDTVQDRHDKVSGFLTLAHHSLVSRTAGTRRRGRDKSANRKQKDENPNQIKTIRMIVLKGNDK